MKTLAECYSAKTGSVRAISTLMMVEMTITFLQLPHYYNYYKESRNNMPMYGYMLPNLSPRQSTECLQ